MVCYVGTSGLSKRYIAENGSGWLRSLIDPSTGNEVYIVRLTAVEIIAAITRRERGGSLLASDAAIARTDFRVDLATGSVPLQSG